MFHFEDIGLPLICEVVQKGGLEARFVGGRDTSDFGDAFSNRSYFQAWPILVEFLSANSEIRGRITKKKERKKKYEESVVKYKSADMYVGRPNK